MTRRISALVLAALVAAVVAAVVVGRSPDSVGTSQQTAPASSPSPRRAIAAPDWTPLTTAMPAREQPVAPVGPPTLDAVAALAAGGPRRLDAETFAIAANYVLVDVRQEFSGESVVQLIASPRLDPKIRAYLVDDIDGQQEVGTRRAIDGRLDLWIRSQFFGPEQAPTRVNVEIAFNLVSKPLDFRTWTGQRLDLAREDGQWRMVGYSDASAGPITGHNLTPKERRSFLQGPGWRRIPAAVAKNVQ